MPLCSQARDCGADRFEPLLLLAAVEILEEPIRRGDQILISGKIVRLDGGAAQHLGQDFLAVRLRQGFVLVDRSVNGKSHAPEFTANVVTVATR
jgi:hypothetical protein